MSRWITFLLSLIAHNDGTAFQQPKPLPLSQRLVPIPMRRRTHKRSGFSTIRLLERLDWVPYLKTNRLGLSTETCLSSQHKANLSFIGFHSWGQVALFKVHSVLLLGHRWLQLWNVPLLPFCSRVKVAVVIDQLTQLGPGMFGKPFPSLLFGCSD